MHSEEKHNWPSLVRKNQDEFLAQSSTNFYGKRRCENFYILQPKSKYTYETKGIMQFS